MSVTSTDYSSDRTQVSSHGSKRKSGRTIMCVGLLLQSISLDSIPFFQTLLQSQISQTVSTF